MENPFTEIMDRLDKIESEIKGLQFHRPEEEQIMNIADTAKFLGLAKQTVYQLVSKKSIPSMKRAGRLYFSKMEIVRWLKANRRISPVEAMDVVDSEIAET